MTKLSERGENVLKRKKKRPQKRKKTLRKSEKETQKERKKPSEEQNTLSHMPLTLREAC